MSDEPTPTAPFVERRADPPKKSFLGLVPDFDIQEAILVGLIALAPLLLAAVCYLSQKPEEFAQQMANQIMDLLKVDVGGILGWGTMFVSAMVRNMNGGNK